MFGSTFRKTTISLPKMMSAVILFAGVTACSDSKPSAAGIDASGATDNDADSDNAVDDAGTQGEEDSASADDAGEEVPDGGANLDAATDSASIPFAMTSSALVEGGKFQAANTCNGNNTSPPFQWTRGPAGTASYAIVLKDKTNNLLHWAIYDIAASFSEAPAAIATGYRPAAPAGAKQAKNYSGSPKYAGPCPPSEHTYEFTLYAIDVANLPGTSANTPMAELVTLINGHKLGSASLTGKYKQP